MSIYETRAKKRTACASLHCFTLLRHFRATAEMGINVPSRSELLEHYFSIDLKYQKLSPSEQQLNRDANELQKLFCAAASARRLHWGKDPLHCFAGDSVLLLLRLHRGECFNNLTILDVFVSVYCIFIWLRRCLCWQSQKEKWLGRWIHAERFGLMVSVSSHVASSGMVWDNYNCPRSIIRWE